jgi:nicotinate phosphoribosyltransferase
MNVDVKAAGPHAKLYEMGLRRAQGPDGGLTASRACYLGGFSGSSNALAGRSFGLPMLHTHSHSFIQAYHDTHDSQHVRPPHPLG